MTKHVFWPPRVPPPLAPPGGVDMQPAFGLVSWESPTTFSWVDNRTYATYLGIAQSEYTSCIFMWDMSLAASTTGMTWAEFAIASGDLIVGQTVELSLRGFLDVSARVVLAANQDRRDEFAVSGVERGMGLWALVGIQATTRGNFCSRNVRHSVLSVSQGAETTEVYSRIRSATRPSTMPVNAQFTSLLNTGGAQPQPRAAYFEV